MKPNDLKLCLTGILASFAIAASAQETGAVRNYSYRVSQQRAVIGKTLSELRALLGKEVKSEPGWAGGTAYGFISRGYYVYATIGKNDKVGDVFYAANQWPFRKLNAAETNQFFLDNEGDKIYDNFTVSGNWNCRHEFVKKYGREKGFTHWVEYSWDNTTGLVSNYGPINKPKAERFGYQVRTLEQFDAEQKIIKARDGAVADSQISH